MRTPKFTVDSPEVVRILAGVWRSTKKSYYRIGEDGRHIAASIKLELVAAGVASSVASRILQAADLPCLPFVHNRSSKPKATVEREPLTEIGATLEVYEPHRNRKCWRHSKLAKTCTAGPLQFC